MSNDVRRTGRVGKSKISIGRFTYGVNNLSIKQWGEGASLNIGCFCSIATNVTIFLGGNHRVDWITTFPFGHIFQEELGGHCIEGHPCSNGDVHIGNDVWIGSGATILSGVTIGDGAVLAANANVASDVLPFTIVGGNPAKIIKMRFSDEIISLLLNLRWWDLPLDDIRAIGPILCSPPSEKLLANLMEKYRS